ncbi:beta-2-glycoprotein 1-like isoform 1-T1 [Clarias gariepinus]|uniref:beta-2-glycoprotein 1-like isoform X1 n=1 Tax=Clarias gariepinus TaxID=13013 RepID=UPI00234C649F|nr:beta-2-glycoprotein 1-like isoform X1 [Clarias gariepinus]
METAQLLLLLCVWALSSLSLQSEVTEHCPERILGKEGRRTCPKKCQQDDDCGNKRQCLCDGSCGLSCVAPGRTCPWPLPDSGHFNVTLLSSSPSFSSLMEVRCHPGYAMADGRDITLRRCQGDRQWSGDEPVCTGKTAETEPESKLSCPLPDNELLLIHGSAAVGSTVQYQCTPGSVLVGNSENVCHKDQTWRYPHPICQRMFCPPPQEVNHGRLVAVQKTEYNLGDAIYYLCKKSFLMDGPNEVTCQLDGTWSTAPSCRAHCSVPVQRSRVIVGGVKSWPYELTDRKVTHGENVTFFCKHPQKHCSFTSTETCFDGLLPAPRCYVEPSWVQYNFYTHRVVSEINPCDPADLNTMSE